MAPNHISKATSSATLGKTPVACHDHWNWLDARVEKDPNALFAAKTLDISRGCKVISTILSQHLVDLSAIHDGDDAVRPLLNGNDTEALARLMVVSLQALYESADWQVEHFNKQAQEGARA